MSIYSLLPSVAAQSNSFEKIITNPYFNAYPFFWQFSFYQGYSAMATVTDIDTVNSTVNNIINLPPLVKIYNDKGTLVNTIFVGTDSSGIPSSPISVIKRVTIYNNLVLITYGLDGQVGIKTFSVKGFDFSGNFLFKLTPQTIDTRVYYSRNSSNNSDSFGLNMAVGSNRILISRVDSTIETPSIYVYDINGNFINRVYHSDLGLTGNYYFKIISNYIIAYYGYETVNGTVGAGKVYVYDINFNLLFSLISPSPTSNGYFWGGFDYLNNNCIDIINNKIYVSERGMNKVYVYDINGNLVRTITVPNTVNLTLNYNFGLCVKASDNYIIISCGNMTDPLTFNPPVNDTGTIFIYDLNGNLKKTISRTKKKVVFQDIYYGGYYSINSDYIAYASVEGIYNNKIYVINSQSANDTFSQIGCLIIKSI